MTALSPAAVPHRPLPPPRDALATWLGVQPVSLGRHVAGFSLFRKGEFGTGAASPSEGHLQAVNRLIKHLRDPLLSMPSRLTAQRGALPRFLELRAGAMHHVKTLERAWNFYFTIFTQRQTRFADMLLSCDRIALDCYEQSFMNLGRARSIPAPPPFAYVESGNGPATFRRDVPLPELAQHGNPFPLVQLPYHRLMNPWTLGAILHEVSHNLQNDLGVDKAVPRRIAERLRAAKLPPSVVETYVRNNREVFADMLGTLLGGVSVARSLIDVIAGNLQQVSMYSDEMVHPVPWLRTFITCELLRCMGFRDEATAYRRMWLRMYPRPASGSMPKALLQHSPAAIPIVVDTICYTRYDELGGRSFAEIVPFHANHQAMIAEAAGRLAAGTDPGVVPARFLIGAARVALERQLAPADVIARNFYAELARR